MKIKDFLFFTFASSAIVLLVSGKDANASLKKQYKQRSSCSYETATFQGKSFKSEFNDVSTPPRYCITSGNQVIRYYNLRSPGETLKGKVGEDEIYWDDYRNSYYLKEYEIDGDKLIGYSCKTSNSSDCSGTLNRYVLGTKTNNKYPTYTYKNGNQYTGKLVNGNLQGKGIFKWANGDLYEGDFLNGDLQGKGILKWASGNSYEGDFINGERTGKGIFKWANGDSYEGDFLNNNFQGKGILKWASGETYEGDFINDERTGYGKYINSKGQIVYEGKFLKGEFLGR